MCRQSFIGGVLILLVAVSMAEGAMPGSRNLYDPAAGGPEDGATGSPSATNPESESWLIAKAVSPEYTIRRTVPEVRFQFNASDEHGRLVTRLAAGDVRVFDN
jgi:hypothetical protein